MNVATMLKLLQEWGVEACASSAVMYDVASPVMLKCAESSTCLMEDALRRRLVQ